MDKSKIISKEDVEKVAKLARIDLTDQEKERFSKELSDVLDNFKELSQLDLAVVGTKNSSFLDVEKNQVRDDRVVECSEEEKEDILKQFPKRKDDYLEVEAVL
jgi:aspartyl-tRNA(Asn)/glutamyl-tRNA(Gln) amidotransferase subunit C